MFIVLERDGTPGRYFPKGASIDSHDYVCDLQQAQHFKLEFAVYSAPPGPGTIKAHPPLPRTPGWHIRQVELRLI